MRVKVSNKVVNNRKCYDVVSRGKVIKTFIGEAQAEAYITESKIKKYTKSKSYKEDLAFLNYYAGENEF